MHCTAVLVAVSLTLAQPATIDGDTLRDGDERYRVENIDAPERGARAACPEERALAEAASTYVREWIAGARRVDAHTTGRRDRYGRIVARIEVDGVDFRRTPHRARTGAALAGSQGGLLLRRLTYCQPLDDASAAASLVGRAIKPFCVMRTSYVAPLAIGMYAPEP
jgi:hypothetical protein